MAKRGHRTTLDRILLAITALFVLGGFMALGFLNNVSQENRALLVTVIIVSSFGMFACLAGFVFVSAFWRQLRQSTWQRAMSSWNRSSQIKSAPKFVLSAQLPERELRQLAVQSYSRMGYRVLNKLEDGVYLQLINPERKLELVACKQGPEPVALHHVYSLDLEMKRTKAVHAFFWAPAGFTDECAGWVTYRDIILADQNEIGRLVDCAQAKGSRLLEQ